MTDIYQTTSRSIQWIKHNPMLAFGLIMSVPVLFNTLGIETRVAESFGYAQGQVLQVSAPGRVAGESLSVIPSESRQVGTSRGIPQERDPSTSVGMTNVINNYTTVTASITESELVDLVSKSETLKQMLKGEKGDKGDQGISLQVGYTSPTSSNPGSYGGVTFSSAKSFSTETLTVTGETTLKTITVTGSSSFGALTATTFNGLTITTSTGTLTIANAKTLTANNTLGFSGTDSTTFTFPGTSDTVVTLTATQTLTNKTLTSPVIANIAPGADFTLTQNSITPFVSVNAGAVINTLYLKTGNVGVGTTTIGTFIGGAGTSGRILQITNTADHARLLINAGGSGKLADIFLEVGDASATKRVFGMRYDGASNIVKNFFLNEATGAITQDNVLVLKNDGNVGIGVSDPTSRFQIGRTDIATGDFVLRATQGNSAGAFAGTYGNELRTNTSGAALNGTLISHLENNSARDILVLANSSGPTVTFESTGNVGIGSTNPGVLLDVLSTSASAAIITSPNSIVNGGANLIIRTDDAHAIDKGGKIGFYGKYDAAGNYGPFASIAGRSAVSGDGQHGYLQFNTNDGSGQLERMRINHAGQVMVGTTTAAISAGGIFNVLSNLADPTGNVRFTNFRTTDDTSTTTLNLMVGTATTGTEARFIAFRAATTTETFGTEIGKIDMNNNAVAYLTTSDGRLKENILDTTLGLEALMQIKVRDYNFISDPEKAKRQGFIAQELYTVYPEAVSVGGDDPAISSWAVEYGRLTPLIIKSVQELNDKLTNLSVVSITSISGKWSIDENGVLIAEKIKTKEICFDEICIDKQKVKTLLEQNGLLGQGTGEVAGENTSTESGITNQGEVAGEDTVIPPISTSESEAGNSDPESSDEILNQVQNDEAEPEPEPEPSPPTEELPE